MKQDSNIEQDIRYTEEEFGKLHTITRDILDKYLKLTRIKKRGRMTEIMDAG